MLNCGDERSCQNADAEVDADDEFLLECTGEDSCRNTGGTRVFNIDCEGKSIKGIKCGGENSCQGLTIIVNGGVDGCDLEKVECDGEDSCRDADFQFIGNVDVGDFICGGEDACVDLDCSGSSECPN